MGIIRFIQAHNRNKQLKGMRQLKEQELDILEQRELRDIRGDSIKHRTYNSSVEGTCHNSCQICGRSGNQKRFYLITEGKYKGKMVCEDCSDDIDKEAELKNKSQDEALKILRTRYAKGEIAKEQFEQMKKDLEN